MLPAQQKGVLLSRKTIYHETPIDFFLLLRLIQCYGQVDNKSFIGTVDSVYSKILKENREIWVYLPDNFDRKQ